jgi:hypothetical protein
MSRQIQSSTYHCPVSPSEGPSPFVLREEEYLHRPVVRPLLVDCGNWLPPFNHSLTNPFEFSCCLQEGRGGQALQLGWDCMCMIELNPREGGPNSIGGSIRATDFAFFRLIWQGIGWHGLARDLILLGWKERLTVDGNLCTCAGNWFRISHVFSLMVCWSVACMIGSWCSWSRFFFGLTFVLKKREKMHVILPSCMQSAVLLGFLCRIF